MKIIKDFLNFLFPNKKTFLTEEDKKELLQLKKNAYMDEARKLIAENGKKQAENDLGFKQEIKKDG